MSLHDLEPLHRPLVAERTNGTDHPPIRTDWSLSFDQVDDPTEGQRWSTWRSVDKGSRGPKPRPDWVVTDDAAIDTELGVLKTGKEADVFLVERAVPGNDDRAVVMAAKRYRSADHRTFHRTRSTPRAAVRVAAAMRARSLRRQRTVAASPPANGRTPNSLHCRGSGRPVSPSRTRSRSTAPSCSWSSSPSTEPPHRGWPRSGPRPRCSGPTSTSCGTRWVSSRSGWAHGDLSAYNILAADDRIVIIDLPQLVDIVGNPQGMDLLQRDCRNVCAWFRAKGLDVDEEELFGELLGQVL